MTRKITLLMTSSLMFSVLVLATGVRPGAEARPGPMGASPATTQASQSCEPPITVTEVHYLGKFQGFDSVRVVWTANGGCLSALGKDFQVVVFVTRKLGHVDSERVHHIVNSAPIQNTLVKIARAVAETDPKTYEVTITGQVGGAPVSIDAAPRQATLAEASGAGMSFPLAQSAGTCLTSTITGIAYKGNRTVEVRANATSACVRPIGADITVYTVTQAAGQPERESSSRKNPPYPGVPGGVTSAGPFNANLTLSFDVPADPIIRFRVELKSLFNTAHEVFGTKVGNF